MKNIANIITFTRIPLSLSLLLCYKYYFPFCIIYLLCGISDVLDGYIARKTKTESTIGSKLDSFADFIMFMVIIAVLCMWSWNELLHYVSFIILIFIIRIINIFIIRFKFHQWGVYIL